MNVNVVYRGRSAVVCSLETFELLMDLVESLPDADERYPMLMRCEGRGVHYTRKESAALALELLRLPSDLGEHSEARLTDLDPTVTRFAHIALWCVRNREPIFIETSGSPTQKARVSSQAGCRTAPELRQRGAKTRCASSTMEVDSYEYQLCRRSRVTDQRLLGAA